MKRDRNVLLFGAGAVIDWDAPFTSELTTLVRSSGFHITDNKTTITEFLYQKLLNESNYPESEINFETLINVIEELIAYYANFNPNKRLPSVISTFFDSKFENELLNFSVEGVEVKHGFKLEIPKGKRSEYARSAINNETPEQFFFQLLLAEIITLINNRISKYSYHTKGLSKVLTQKNKEINQLFRDWIKKLTKSGIARMYTLNYDRNFKIVLETSDEPIPIFEGFNCDHTIEYGTQLAADVPKIISDSECNVLYNLHGSVFWDVEARNVSQLPNPIFFLREAPNFPINSYEQAVWQSEKGRTIMLTNIITGYQKTQRGIFPPYKQMLSAFDNDCIDADTIYIVGYSFGDEHINGSLRSAIQYNPKAKFIIVEPSFTKNGFDLNVAIKIFSSAGDAGEMKARTTRPKVHSFFDSKFVVHEKTFRQFLVDQNSVLNRF